MTTTPNNPHGFEEHVIDALHDTSSKMYNHFYDLLATYQFDFNAEEKEWMLQEIVKDIQGANIAAEMEKELDT